MTPSRWLILGAAVLVGLYVFLRPVPPPVARPSSNRSGGDKTASLGASSGNPGSPSSPAAEEVDPGPPPLTGPLPAPNPASPRKSAPAATPVSVSAAHLPSAPEPPQLEIESIALNLRQYQLRFGGNPVGTNAEIVRELNGGNTQGTAYLPSSAKRLNDQGELIDTWGTPYFFHQESADKMEIRSAGPDAVLWTDDDIVAR